MGNSQKDKDHEALWADLETGLAKIFKNPQPSPNRYMTLSFTVYSFLQSPLPNSHESPLHPTRMGHPHLEPGFLLYTQLKDWLNNYVSGVFKRMTGINGDDLLIVYTKEWEAFISAVRIFHGVFKKLNTWVKYSKEVGQNVYENQELSLVLFSGDIHPIDQMFNSAWKDVLKITVLSRLIEAGLDIIGRDRDGEVVEKNLLSAVISSFERVEFICEGDCEKKQETERWEEDLLRMQFHMEMEDSI